MSQTFSQLKIWFVGDDKRNDPELPDVSLIVFSPMSGVALSHLEAKDWFEGSKVEVEYCDIISSLSELDIVLEDVKAQKEAFAPVDHGQMELSLTERMNNGQVIGF